MSTGRKSCSKGLQEQRFNPSRHKYLQPPWDYSLPNQPSAKAAELETALGKDLSLIPGDKRKPSAFFDSSWYGNSHMYGVATRGDSRRRSTRRSASVKKTQNLLSPLYTQQCGVPRTSFHWTSGHAALHRALERSTRRRRHQTTSFSLPIIKSAAPPPIPSPIRVPGNQARDRARVWDIRTHQLLMQNLVNRLADRDVDFTQCPKDRESPVQALSIPEERFLWSHWKKKLPWFSRGDNTGTHQRFFSPFSCSDSDTNDSQLSTDRLKGQRGRIMWRPTARGSRQKVTSRKKNTQRDAQKTEILPIFDTAQLASANPEIPLAVNSSTDSKDLSGASKPIIRVMPKAAKHLAFITMTQRATRVPSHPAVSQVVLPPQIAVTRSASGPAPPTRKGDLAAASGLEPSLRDMVISVVQNHNPSAVQVANIRRFSVKTGSGSPPSFATTRNSKNCGISRVGHAAACSESGDSQITSYPWKTGDTASAAIPPRSAKLLPSSAQSSKRGYTRKATRRSSKWRAKTISKVKAVPPSPSDDSLWIKNSSVKTYKHTLGAVVPATPASAPAASSVPVSEEQKSAQPRAAKKSGKPITHTSDSNAVVTQSGGWCMSAGRRRSGAIVSIEKTQPVVNILPRLVQLPVLHPAMPMPAPDFVAASKDTQSTPVPLPPMPGYNTKSSWSPRTSRGATSLTTNVSSEPPLSRPHISPPTVIPHANGRPTRVFVNSQWISSRQQDSTGRSPTHCATSHQSSERSVVSAMRGRVPTSFDEHSSTTPHPAVSKSGYQQTTSSEWPGASLRADCSTLPVSRPSRRTVAGASHSSTQRFATFPDLAPNRRTPVLPSVAGTPAPPLLAATYAPRRFSGHPATPESCLKSLCCL